MQGSQRAANVIFWPALINRNLKMATKFMACFAALFIMSWLMCSVEGVKPGTCPVSLPRNSPAHCRKIREQQLAKQRAIFRLKSPTPGGLKPPLLNMSIGQFLEVFGSDPFEKEHLLLYRQMAGFNRRLFGLWSKINSGTPIEKLDDYKHIFNFFFSRQAPLGGNQFRSPSEEEPFQDVINKWKDDKIFSEQRLAGLNAMSLQRVYNDKARGPCDWHSCGSGGRCLKSGRCLCYPGHTGPNAVLVGHPGPFRPRQADNCKTPCILTFFGWKCPRNVPSLQQGLKWSDLKKRLNPNFNWEHAVQEALETDDTLHSAISKGYVYALNYPLCDNVVTVSPDITEPDPRRKVWEFNSPIALFVSKPLFEDDDPNSDEPIFTVEDEAENQKIKKAQFGSVGKEQFSDEDEKYDDELLEEIQRSKASQNDKPVEQDAWRRYGGREFVPVAIQMDFLPKSAVHTPRDGDLWTLAKLNLQVTDYGYHQIVEHLLKTHFLMEPVCVALRRHIYEDHPLAQILKFHCRGLMTTTTLGGPTLILPGQNTHRLFAFGYIGTAQLVNTGYLGIGWKETDFKNNIKKRGLYDRRSLPFFPYRDDGLVMFNAIGAMVQEYIRTYYSSDEDVEKDSELQRFANEISADGKGPDGGRGMMKGFPAKVTSRGLLVNIITRIISQLTIQHACVNYPLINYAAFTPLTPTKMYNDSRVRPDQFDILDFPNAIISALQSTFQMSLATFRFDSLFDYSGQLRDKRGRQVVDKHFCRLRRVIQPYLERVNLKRFKEGHLTYPYLLPRWLPNGIQT